MAEEREAGRPSQVAVVDGEVPDSGWQRLDLAALAGLPADVPLDLSGPVATPVRHGIPVRPAPTLAAVPAEALITVARRAPERRFAKRGPGPSANDNAHGSRSAWRDAFFLAVLFATVAVAFWGGRLHAYQRVIVVPQPTMVGGVIT